MNLEALSQTIDKLSEDAAHLDRQRGEHHQPLFDQQLFHCKAKLIVPCVSELRSTYHSIVREKESGKLTSLRAEFLTERLLAQLTAIQRELATVTIRKKEPKHYTHFRKPINELYQELAQHQEWERRLKDMVKEKEFALSSAPPFQQANAQKALIATEQRLKRCQQAKLNIEKKITFREKNQ
ncbi:primosomal replication protein PriC [Vibrio sonorensis]|uniref:primosomal replication protein PriC n=1 Tax=Vibrio sonorensis TaxID=1004316 RepID=UPI0008DA0E46|nr:primosomal replication protein [Vibrio sonorensis]